MADASSRCREDTGKPGHRDPGGPQPPFALWVPCPLQPPRSGRTQPRPQVAAPTLLLFPAASSSNSWGTRQPRLPRPRAAPCPPVLLRQAKGRRARRPRDKRLGRFARVLLSCPLRVCLLGLSSSPPLLHLPGSKPQAGFPRAQVPRPSPPWLSTRARLSLGVPRLSAPSFPARRPSPAPSWRRSWCFRLAERPQSHSPRGRGAAPAPGARAGSLPRDACPGASARRAGALAPSSAGA